jgi:Fic family protein
MRIEACREAIHSLPLSEMKLESLRTSARLMSTHFSTQIEGNRQDVNQVQAVLKGVGRFPISNGMNAKYELPPSPRVFGEPDRKVEQGPAK